MSQDGYSCGYSCQLTIEFIQNIEVINIKIINKRFDLICGHLQCRCRYNL